MTGATNIGWADYTWNPTTGCLEISPGCGRCYARKQAEKLQARSLPSYRNGFKFTLQPQRMEDPLRIKKPAMIFVNSMSDLAFEEMPQQFFNAIMATMVHAHWHIFQVLTKRPTNLLKLLANWIAADRMNHRLPRNVIWGVSVEDARYKWRMDELRAISGALHFVSIEPLLGPVGKLDLTDIHWVICGGESGKYRRPFKLDWAREVRDQCVAAKVPFFYKQGGHLYPGRDRVLDGRTWDEFPKEVEHLARKQ